MDFGLAKLLKPGMIGKGSHGTLYYKSPELIRGVEWNTKVDVWALGVTVFYWLTGQLPYESGWLERDQIESLILSGSFSRVKRRRISREASNFV